MERFNAERGYQGGDAVRVDIRRLLLANAMTPLAGNKPLVDAIQQHGEAVFGARPLVVGSRTPIVRACTRNAASWRVIYGAGPRTVLSPRITRQACRRARIVLEDGAAPPRWWRTLHDLLA